MKVFKFGGASVKDADGVKNVAEVMRLHSGDSISVVISAMGKTTNALEELTKAYFTKSGNAGEQLQKLKDFHHAILEDLFESTHPIFDEVNNTFVEIEWAIEDEPTGTYDFEYDQIVSVGEMLSTKIVSAYLNEIGIENTWMDARDFINTDNTYREGRIDWELSQQSANRNLKSSFTGSESKVIITQGFIGVTSENFTTTLGREGSDFTAAIIAYLLDAESVTIWKDVPGVLNADPKWFDSTIKLSNLSYGEAIELTYYGTSVIHPRTIQPLQNKGIPLYVKSFINPSEEGTLIDANTSLDKLIPSFIFRVNQILIKISPKDYSFIMEDNLRDIFTCFTEHGVRINMMQNLALSFSVSVTQDELKMPGLLKDLEKNFLVESIEG
ncbi:MAG: aspartate kinase, partial [Flavobacteriales bacterium]|nr:aspartate kinase [Flavobacteriales bacterium]